MKEMTKFDTCLKEIYFAKLKNLKDLQLNFMPYNVTGIFGENCSGKSTIIHALTAVFQPATKTTKSQKNIDNYKFSRFFKSTPLSNWKDSNFKITYFAETNNNFTEKVKQYSKNNRWQPKYNSRPKRDVYFIGLDTCVPAVETERSKSRINLLKAGDSNFQDKICESMSIIFNKKYKQAVDYKSNKRRYSALTDENIGEYSSLSMGAGEQRVFKILTTLYAAQYKSLIIIDEIDLTLHTYALNKLLDMVVDLAEKRKLQVIFTSHREELLKREDINIRHIMQRPGKTLCLPRCTSECLRSLTGKIERKLQIFVEDALSEAIMIKLTVQKDIKQNCEILNFGSIENAFTIAAAKVLENAKVRNLLIVLDGDKYKDKEEKLNQLKKKLTGTEKNHEAKLDAALNLFTEYSLGKYSNPEEFIYHSLKNSTALEQNKRENFPEIHACSDNHEYVNKLITNWYGDEDPTKYYSHIVEEFSKTKEWNEFVENIANVLKRKKEDLQF